jgi:hypothetical protein
VRRINELLRGTRVNYDVLYANILVHEVLYHGMLSYSLDDLTAEMGSFASTMGVAGALLEINQPWVQRIDAALGL